MHEWTECLGNSPTSRYLLASLRGKLKRSFGNGRRGTKGRSGLIGNKEVIKAVTVAFHGILLPSSPFSRL